MNIDTPLYLYKIHAPPPTILSLTVPNRKDRHHRISRSTDLHSAQPRNSHSSHMIDFHVNKRHIYDKASLSFGWQRHSDKMACMASAPDVAYRNTYLEGTKRKQSNIDNSHYQFRSVSPLRPQSSQRKYQYRSKYDYIRSSIRQVEQQRNCKEDMSLHVRRPQNEDSTLQHILNKGRSSARNSSTEIRSSLSNNDLPSSPTVVNYINHFRVLHSATPNQSNRQQN